MANLRYMFQVDSAIGGDGLFSLVGKPVIWNSVRLGPAGAWVARPGRPTARPSAGRGRRAVRGAPMQRLDPAVLKNAIDWISRYRPSPLANKPCAVLTASARMVGGARVQYEFRRSLGFLNALVMLQPEIFITTAQGKFDADCELTDASTREILAAQTAAFHQWSLAMERAVPPL